MIRITHLEFMNSYYNLNHSKTFQTSIGCVALSIDPHPGNTFRKILFEQNHMVPYGVDFWTSTLEKHMETCIFNQTHVAPKGVDFWSPTLGIPKTVFPNYIFGEFRINQCIETPTQK